MSPSELDLRAALRDGDDGDDRSVNADHIIAGGQRIRARRMRMVTGSALAVFVVAGGIGLASLGGGDSAKSGGGGSNNLAGGAGSAASAAVHRAADAPAVPSPAAGAGGAVRSTEKQVPSANTQYGADMVLARCPQRAPQTLIDTARDTTGRLFTHHVAKVVVCSYGAPLKATSEVVPATLVFNGAAGQQLATSLENASSAPRPTPCPTSLKPSRSRVLAIVGVTASGDALAPLAATLTDPACDVIVTNGDAVRYDWVPTESIRETLLALTPRRADVAALPSAPPSNANGGSPVHS